MRYVVNANTSVGPTYPGDPHPRGPWGAWQVLDTERGDAVVWASRPLRSGDFFKYEPEEREARAVAAALNRGGAQAERLRREAGR